MRLKEEVDNEWQTAQSGRDQQALNCQRHAHASIGKLRKRG